MGVEIVGGIIVSPRNFLRTVRVALKNGAFCTRCLPPFFQPSPQTLFSLSCPTATHLSHVDTWSWTCNSLRFHLLLVLKGRMCYVRVSPTALYLRPTVTNRKKCDRPPRRRAARWGRPR